MKAVLFALAGSLVGSAAAHAHKNHAAFHKRHVLLSTTGSSEPEPTCGCTTYVTTIYGEATLVPEPEPSTSTIVEATSTVTVVKTVDLPTPTVTVCPTPGTYTFPEKTVIVTETTVVAVPTTTVLVPGTQTYGGVTTTVVESTTVTVPVAEETEVITTTVHVCPSAGQCVIAPTTTVVVEETTVVYPVPSTFVPGTYTAPATTITVTETDYVYICPYTVVVTPTPVPEAPAPESPVSAPAPVPTPETPKEEAPKESPKEEGPKPIEETSAGSIAPKLNGKQWALTYTPYNKDGTCKGPAAVVEDIKKIRSKGFTTIRVYSTDCGALASLNAVVQQTDVRLILGIFIDSRGLGFAKEQLADLKTWTHWDRVDLIVVGNEAVFGGFISPHDLAAFILESKSTLAAVGCKAKFTTTETLNTLQQNGVAAALCPVIDVVGANVQAFFTASVTPESAGSFVHGQLEIAKSLCGGTKEAYNLESGWPSYAWAPNGNAVAGKAEQKTAILSIIKAVGEKSVLFSYEDDDWKGDGFQGVEKHYGCGWIF